MANKTFKHSGDLGDIIFALPAMRALGGGVLYLDPDGGQSEPLVRKTCFPQCRTRLNADSIDWLRPLLVQQEYISDVRSWSGEPIDHNLDLFRGQERQGNLADIHLRAFGLSSSCRDDAWLRVDQVQKVEGRPMVISRTLRKHGNHRFWEAFLREYHEQILFVGLPEEHMGFEALFGVPVQYHPTSSALEMARVIAAAQRFAGNPGAANAVAEGLKQNKILEVYRTAPNELFRRPGAEYV